MRNSRKITALICCGMFVAGACAAPTTIDTVIVPPTALHYQGMDSAGGTPVYHYSGRINYWLRTGDNDSLSISFAFLPEGSSAAVAALTAQGDAGIKSVINAENGEKVIEFAVDFPGAPPQGRYQARVSIVAQKSALEQKVDSIMTILGNNTSMKVDQLHGRGDYTCLGFQIGTVNMPGLLMADGPHGVRFGNASLFPTSAAEANTWDTALVHRVGTAIGKESKGYGRYVSLGPMINLVRDPRGGRNFETYSEDPYLTGKMAAADIRGIQSVRTIACPKHFVCNDREQTRDFYSSDVSERALREMYAYPFEIAISEGKPWSVMSSYNKVNSTYTSENSHLLTDILRNDWGFRGLVMSDFGASHSVAPSANAGMDVQMDGGTPYQSGLAAAVGAGQVSTAVLDELVRTTIRARLWAGVLGGDTRQGYSSSINCADHKALALEAGRKSITLVKNDNHTLPLDTNISLVAVVGPYANAARTGGGGSSLVTPFYSVSPIDGIKNRIGAAKVTTDWNAAQTAIVFVGVTGETEGSDRVDLGISAEQNTLVQSIMNAGKKCIVVFTGGSAAIKGAWADAPAVIIAFYPGEEQGNAIADVIFGKYNPAGKLAVTFPIAATQLPPFDITNGHILYEDASEGRGYTYYDKHNLLPLFCFGLGLSYTTFSYSNIRVSPASPHAGDRIVVQADVTNTGVVAGDEIAQLYLGQQGATDRPIRQLRGFARLSLNAGETRTATFALAGRDFARWDSTQSRFVVPAGTYTVQVGASSRNLPLSASLTMAQ
jgi:beta-glucosidase